MRPIVPACMLIASGFLLAACSATTHLLVATHYDNRIEELPIGQIAGTDARAQFVGVPADPDQQQQVERTMTVYRALVTSASFRQMNTRITRIIADPQLHTVTIRLRNCDYLVLKDEAASPSELQSNQTFSTSAGNFLIKERGVWRPCGS